MIEAEPKLQITEEKEIQIKKFRIKFWIIDILAVIVSYAFAYLIRNSFGTGLLYTNNYIFLLLFMIPTFFILIRRSNFTHIHEKLNFGILLFNFFQLCIFGLLIIFFFLFIFKMKDISRVFVLTFFIIYMIVISILQVYRSRIYQNIWKDADKDQIQ
jgi:FlaA1/EpsC-like NDP-sugar epimerase